MVAHSKKSLSPTARRVLGFLVAKGLLISTDVKPMGTAKLTLIDCLRVAREVEPRVLAVLPAALIHFPKSFLDYGEMPKALRNVLDAITAGKTQGPDFAVATFAEMRRWAYAKLKDGRAKPLDERKVRRTYRFKPLVIRLLANGAKVNHSSETALLESLVEANLK